MKRVTQRTLLSTAIALATFQAHGAGFQISEHSASGLGRAFAGEAAIADNAAVAVRNPAAMTMFDAAQVSGGLSFIQPDVDAKVSDASLNGTTLGADEHSDVAPDALVPNFHYVRPLNDKMAVGFSTFSNFGLSTEYPTDSPAGAIGGQTELLTVDFNANLAYEVSDQLSLGVGLNAVYADAELKRQKGILSSGFVLGGSATDEISYLAGDGWGFGWNAGALWQFNENNRVGASYRSKVDITLEGDYRGTSATGTVAGELELNLPDIFEFSGFHKLGEQWAVHYSAMRIGWSSFQELRATSSQCLSLSGQGVCLQKDEKWENTWRYSLGATYYLNDKWELRAGYAKDESPVPDAHRTLSIPDTERDWYSLGATYYATDNLSIDAGFAYLSGDDVNGTESENLPGGAVASYDFTAGGDAYIYALSANYTF
ncbi:MULTISPECIES: outer membrane protein transport protein [Grimontia]|uniref:Long-chain fatty acid transport protein n=1 Tax=Grimontia marina TaxID=646534 RepID=A0A128F3S7_9GAMM|nr:MULTISPECIES: outer membrane protein transport protein [Grimontia]WRV98959.1 outer membrane protein transport protein [Grimontia sp. NTOU-MAR1]CZF81453.1 Long-chain fatty acid transport protein precursor [Grimontia marina]